MAPDAMRRTAEASCAAPPLAAADGAAAGASEGEAAAPARVSSGSSKAAAKAREYVRGMAWLLQMYAEGVCGDLGYIYPFENAPPAASLALYLEEIATGCVAAVRAPLSELPALPAPLVYCMLVPPAAMDQTPVAGVAGEAGEAWQAAVRNLADREWAELAVVPTGPAVVPQAADPPARAVGGVSRGRDRTVAAREVGVDPGEASGGGDGCDWDTPADDGDEDAGGDFLSEDAEADLDAVDGLDDPILGDQSYASILASADELPSEMLARARQLAASPAWLVVQRAPTRRAIDFSGGGLSSGRRGTGMAPAEVASRAPPSSTLFGLPRPPRVPPPPPSARMRPLRTADPLSCSWEAADVRPSWAAPWCVAVHEREDTDPARQDDVQWAVKARARQAVGNDAAAGARGGASPRASRASK